MKRFILSALVGMIMFCTPTFFVGCKDTNNFLELRNWYGPQESLSIMTNMMVVKHTDNEIVCKFYCDNGMLATQGYTNPLQEVEAQVNKPVSWICYNDNIENKVHNDTITIFLTKNSDVVGYAIVNVDIKENNIDYQAIILAQKLLKQPVTEKEAQELVNEVKNKNGG